MILSEFAEKLGISPICGNLYREVSGCYAGDLLSWVMSHAGEGDVWVTIMSNLNVVAVASLTDAACVIMAEGVSPDDDALAAAKEKGITIFSDSRSVYELCRDIGKLI